MITTTSGLQYEDTKPGDGPLVSAGQLIRLNYRIALSLEALLDGANERLIDFSEKHKEPVEATTAAGELLVGIEEGLQGMRIGGARRLIIPSRLAFGRRGVPGKIPQDATLYVDLNVSTKSILSQGSRPASPRHDGLEHS